jgi:hypothetical protein
VALVCASLSSIMRSRATGGPQLQRFAVVVARRPARGGDQHACTCPTSVELRPVTLALPIGKDAIEAADRMADTGVGRAVLAAVPDAPRPAAMDAVRTALAAHTDAGGAVNLGAGIWIIIATQPAS